MAQNLVRELVPVLVVLGLAEASAAQPPIVVQGGGAALQQAINAAPPNAVLDVWAATYDPIVVQQPLTIACRPGVQILTSLLPPPAVTITGLPAGTAFTLTGGAFTSMAIQLCDGTVVVDRTVLPPVGGGQLVIAQCSGPVVMRDVQVDLLPHIAIDACSQVSFTDCDCPQLQIGTSQVLLTNCSIPANLSRSAIQINSGDVTIVGGSYAGQSWAGLPIDPPAIDMYGGRLTVTGSATLTAATFWAANFPSPTQPLVPAVVATAGEVHVDPSTQFVTLNANPVSAPTVVYEYVPHLGMTWVAATSALQLDVVGEPGSLVFTAFSAPAVPLELSFGELWLDPAAYLVLDLAVLPAGGSTTLAIQVPPLAPFLVLPLQSVAFPTSGGVRLGAPSIFVFG